MNPQKLRVLPCLILLLPFDIVVAAGLLIASAVAAVRPSRRWGTTPPASRSPLLTQEGSLPRPYGRNWRRLCSPPESGGETAKRAGWFPIAGGVGPQKRATIQILNWDGKHLLAECLPSVIDAVRATGANHKILVVDNGSTDGSVQFIREQFPEIRILQLDRNYGFVGGNNRGVQTVKTDIVVLLNNDMIVNRDFLRPLLEGFTDDSVFAVTSQIFLQDPSRRREETGNTRGKFEHGFFTIWHDDIDADEKRRTIPVMWAGGGSCAFDRTKYLQLAGLDDLYHPFYVEDLDLSYRAWKHGWKCLLAPASHVIHKHRATSSRKYTHRFVDETTRRNIFLFIWKNVSDRSMLLAHLINLPRIHGRAMLAAGCRFEIRAYLRAFLKFPLSLWKHLRQRDECSSDREVLARSQP